LLPSIRTRAPLPTSAHCRLPAGGFYDHVPPPVTNVVSPDGLPCVDCAGTPFSFTRLGVRVPAIIVSPWAQARVVSAPPAGAAGVFEHASLPATLRAVLPAWGAPLTARDAAAPPLSPLWEATPLTAPRDDCPATLPAPPPASPALAGVARDGAGPVNDLQRSLLTLLEGAARGAEGASQAAADVAAALAAAGALRSEAAAGLFARARAAALLRRE
jgi:phospholipase C